MIQQAHDQHLIAIDRRQRQVLRLELHRVPQHEHEQCVQRQYQGQDEYPRLARQRRLSPALVTQGRACIAVEQGQTARTIALPLMSALPGTFDDTASFKPTIHTKPAPAICACSGQSSVDRFFHPGFPHRGSRGRGRG